jgi:hypothetical protein
MTDKVVAFDRVKSSIDVKLPVILPDQFDPLG